MNEFDGNLFKNNRFYRTLKGEIKQEKTGEGFMKIWEDEKQVYIRAAMERNMPEQNAALKERLERIDWSILEHIQRKETVNERGVFAPLEAVEVPEIEARRERV